MQSLRDKLLKAGLVTPEQAKKAEEAKAAPVASERPPRERRHEGRHDGPGRRDRDKPERLPPVPKLPPLPGSKEHQRLEAQKQRELDAKLRELVLATQIPLEPGATAFYFVTRKGRLRRLELSEAQAKALEEGRLAVVERQEPAQIEHSLVPPETAEKMHALFPKSVRFFNKPGAAIGFLSDEELKKRQADEARLPRESPEPADAEIAPSEDKPAETWIAVKRAPPPSTEDGTG